MNANGYFLDFSASRFVNLRRRNLPAMAWLIFCVIIKKLMALKGNNFRNRQSPIRIEVKPQYFARLRFNLNIIQYTAGYFPAFYKFFDKNFFVQFECFI